jgi:hypothetical protein
LANGMGWPLSVVSFPDTWQKTLCRTQKNKMLKSTIFIL